MIVWCKWKTINYYNEISDVTECWMMSDNKNLDKSIQKFMFGPVGQQENTYLIMTPKWLQDVSMQIISCKW